ncbi:MAG: DUF4091 domain-containing protein [Clostridia bacterium]|nr:DUF4091 domain-containing protein [Clostridia bacterium]
MFMWVRNSAARVYKSTRKGPADSTSIVLHSAKNMTVSMQVLLREYGDFDVTGVDFPALPDGVGAKYRYQDYITYNDGTPYPDILSPKKSVHVPAQSTQGIWLLFDVSRTASAGRKVIPYVVHTSAGDLSASVTLAVYDVTLPDPCDSAFGHEYFFNAVGQFGLDGDRSHAPLPGFYDFDRYSGEWWALMAEYAKAMKALRVNSLNITVLSFLRDGGSTRVGEKEWRFEFGLLDRFIECFLANGSFRYLTIGSIIRSVTGETIGGIDYEGKHCNYRIFEPDADAWTEALFTAIYRHFEEKGWLPMLVMRLEDEPHTTEYWKWARDIARRCMPGVPCGEPLDMHESSEGLEGYCDQYVPRLEVYACDPAYYKARQAAGDTVWCYSCCFPEEPWWLNKFIDLPHSYARLIKWACFSQGITGFLHWGFNYWSMDSLYGLGGAARFKGDGFIVYPDAGNGTVMMSNRGISTTEGIEDWELLHLLAAKAPEAATAIAARVARSFTDFTDDDVLLEACRAELLELLSE